MTKLFWILSITTFPLLMVENFRIGELPLTHLFLLLAGLLNIKKLLNSKAGRIENKIYFLFLFFIVFSIIDLTRTHSLNVNFFFVIKLISLLFFIKVTSFFMVKYGMNLFLKYLTFSSGIVLIGLLIHSIFILKAPYFVVDAEQITESGKNQVAFYLALVIPFILWYFRDIKTSFFQKMMILTSLSLHLFATIYVQSKGLLLALIFSYAISLLFYSEIKIRLSSIVKLTILSSIPLYLLTSFDFIDLQSFEKDITSLFSENIQKNNSSNERLGLIKKSFEHFTDNPIFGIGTNNFANTEGKATHNNYLQILTENGIIGFFIFISFMLTTHVWLLKMKIKDFNYLTLINILWSLTIYLFVINGFFNAVTTVVLALLIYYEKKLKLITNEQ